MAFLLVNKVENQNHVIWLMRLFPRLLLVTSDWFELWLVDYDITHAFVHCMLDNSKHETNSGS